MARRNSLAALGSLGGALLVTLLAMVLLLASRQGTAPVAGPPAVDATATAIDAVHRNLCAAGWGQEGGSIDFVGSDGHLSESEARASVDSGWLLMGAALPVTLRMAYSNDLTQLWVYSDRDGRGVGLIGIVRSSGGGWHADSVWKCVPPRS